MAFRSTGIKKLNIKDTGNSKWIELLVLISLSAIFVWWVTDLATRFVGVL